MRWRLLHCLGESDVRLVKLDEKHSIQIGTIDSDLIPSDDEFDAIWNLHPEEYSEILIHGKMVKVPRWDQAYERDYPFAKQVAVAKQAPPCMLLFLKWCQRVIDSRMNGMFVNWHDGELKHYHGKHRDSVSGLVPDSSIVTVSLGEERVFRMRPYPSGSPPKDFSLNNGDFVVIPWGTNQTWTHEVPKFARFRSRRVSVTMRAFAET